MIKRLILLRHGESKWNLENRFTGWTDIDLSENGENEAKNAGILLFKEKLKISQVYVSFLKRAIKTSKICLKQLNNNKLDVLYDWRLNERHYGNLQGLNKSETVKKFGEKQVLIWRRSYDTPPPALDESDKRHPKYDSLYKNIDVNLLPNAESLKDTLNRVKPLWKEQILPKLKIVENVLIVAHGNSLRAIVKMIKNLSNEEVLKLNIPTGIPYVFMFNDKFELVSDKYLGNEDEAVRKAKLVSIQGSKKP
jgi:2,3-bisphosphoglycerate-dependent phosphoglycerate mutase